MTDSITDDVSIARSPIVWLAAFGFGGLVWLGGSLDANFTAPGLYKQGVELQKENKCDEAIGKFDDAIKRDGKMVNAYFGRGICHYRLDRYKEARDDYEQAIKLKPDFVEAHYNVGLVYLNLGEADQALASFDNAIRLQPDEPDAHRQRGDILRDRGDLPGALAEYTTLVKLAGKLAHEQRRALVLREMGEFDQAIAAYDRLIGSTEENSFPHNERAATLREKGDIDAAVEAVEAAVRRRPDLAGAYIQRGLIELIVPGRASAAAQDFAKAFEMGNSYREAMLLLDAGARAVGASGIDGGPSIAPNEPYRPAAHYLLIRLHVARQIAGEADATEYADNFGKLAEVRRRFTPPERLMFWPGPVIDLFRGKVTPDEVRAAVRDTRADALRRRRDCEADFYLAEYHLGQGRRNEATPLLASAAAQCPPTAPERDLAKAELKRLGS